MKDQASALRQIVENLKKQRNREPGKGPRVICVSSGKGGVGKTSIAVNMAIALGRKGLRVLLLDADFGLSNVDVLMGVNSQYDLGHVIRGNMRMADVITPGPDGVMLISGGSGLSELIDISGEQLEHIIEKLLSLEDLADIVILDTGAGVNPLILRMIAAAEETLVITTPEPTAIMDAYALVKSISSKTEARQLRLIVNRADTAAEAENAMKKFCSVVKLYLKLDVSPLGYVLDDPMVSKSVRAQRPFIIGYPKCAASRNIESIAWRLMDMEPVKRDSGLRQFIANFIRREP